nr:hypothetical protein [Bacteroides acidifaciens]
MGSNEIPITVSEGISDIPHNKTLIVEKLTAEAPVSPDTITGLTDLRQVFDYFSPNIDVEFENEEGQPVKENLKFRNVADFSINKMTLQSNFLRSLKAQKDFNDYLVKQLRSNKVLQKVLNDQKSRQLFLSVLQELRKEMKESQNNVTNTEAGYGKDR